MKRYTDLEIMTASLAVWILGLIFAAVIAAASGRC